MIPRFSNPHLLVQSTRPTSRAELLEAEGVETGCDVQLIAMLDETLKQSFGDFSQNNLRSPENHDVWERQANNLKATSCLRVSPFTCFL